MHIPVNMELACSDDKTLPQPTLPRSCGIVMLSCSSQGKISQHLSGTLSRQYLISSILPFQAEVDVGFTKVQFCQRNNARHLSGSKNGLLSNV
jgi:hypothetical protein